PMLTINRTGAWENWSHVHGFCRPMLWSGSVTTGQEIPCADYVCKVPFTQGTALNLGWQISSFANENCYTPLVFGPDCGTGPSVPSLPGACNILMNMNRS